VYRRNDTRTKGPSCAPCSPAFFVALASAASAQTAPPVTAPAQPIAASPAIETRTREVAVREKVPRAQFDAVSAQIAASGGTVTGVEKLTPDTYCMERHHPDGLPARRRDDADCGRPGPAASGDRAADDRDDTAIGRKSPPPGLGGGSSGKPRPQRELTIRCLPYEPAWRGNRHADRTRT